ncbi:AP-3 complex subunit delta [Podosphaera aphanis]|nr:AP-3 complex subunit delta [Podosphaera aphanis]
MDLKATALLKLIYLEMFGHDMSWAAFHVLEVMSSTKYLQKRVGYLGAVQSYRPETEVLMLATNLLRKDITSTSVPTMTLPIVTLPHVITPSLALSTLSDLLPRLNHSNPAIRKKTIVTLYRLALVYPETLRPAWPKIKDRLMDEGEDPSVTAAIVNVVCELGWRRPLEFISLAPRLFDLLVNGGNNWMAIKLIKLFATLTPLEPRLVRKLTPPLTSIIRTTPAMSLLYECINGIIQGGILENTDDSDRGEEIASLCVSKLRGMIMVEGDANLKYVALLAFNKIVVTHPYLVAQQEDVIMECIDSPDVSIRLRALDLVAGMVNSDNLMSIIVRLMRQLKNSRSKTPEEIYPRSSPIEIGADFDEELPDNLISRDLNISEGIHLTEDYKANIINRILGMCSGKNYGDLVDFEWYIDILTQLIRDTSSLSFTQESGTNGRNVSNLDISERVGDELRNVAVKVKAVRAQATRAAELVLLSTCNDESTTSTVTSRVLRPIAWIVGEYASILATPQTTLNALMQLIKISQEPDALIIYLQALPKVFCLISGDDQMPWTAERKTMISLIMARIIYTYEPLALHPDLEVQERAVEFSELLKLSAEAISGQETPEDIEQQGAPLLLTQAMASLFSGLELNSVAPGAQKKVPKPVGLDLDQPINSCLGSLLKETQLEFLQEPEEDAFDNYYHQPTASISIIPQPAANRLVSGRESSQTYQKESDDGYLDSDIIARRRAERMERNKDDPFYIAPTADKPEKLTSSLHSILENSNGLDLDVDSIPIMQLDLEKPNTSTNQLPITKSSSGSRNRQQIEVAADETLTINDANSINGLDMTDSQQKIKAKAKTPLLQVDSSHIGAFSLEGDFLHEPTEFGQQKEDAEIKQALKEVERLRLEMQRANERIQAAHGVEGTVVVKKKKKKIKPNQDEGGTSTSTGRKKKVKKAVKDSTGKDDSTTEGLTKKKKKPALSTEKREDT